MTARLDPSLLNASRERATVVHDANDFRQFAALRRGAQANDPQALREAAKQFESLFTKMMLDEMRKASFGDKLFGSDQGDMYQGMMDDQLSVQLSQGRGLGLADMLIRQLGGGAAAAGATPASGSAPAAGAKDAAAPVSDAERKQFVERMLPHATAAARELGVDPRAIVAQAALETGWGRSQPGDSSNNFFGIKAGAGWRGASVVSSTQEFAAGEATRADAQFRAYGSLAENVRDYVHVLRDNPRYAQALDTGGDVQAFAQGLQRGGYATDPRYAEKLVSVAQQIADLSGSAGFKSTDVTPIPTGEPSRMSNG